MSHCAPTLTLTFVRTVDSRGAPRLLVEAGAAAIAQLAAGVVLALTLESGQKKDTWSWHLCSTLHVAFLARSAAAQFTSKHNKLLILKVLCSIVGDFEIKTLIQSTLSQIWCNVAACNQTSRTICCYSQG